VKPLLTAPKRQLIDILQTQLIPWASSGAPLALLDMPPQIIGQNKITEKSGKTLPALQGAGQVTRLKYWRDENLNSVAVPIIGCIIDGEADLEVGATQAACRKLKIEGKRWIVAMPKSTFFLVAPGTPVSGPGKVHWRRAHPEKAYSRMLWMQIHENGAYCHFNTSDKGKLWIAPHLFLRDLHLFPLAQNLIQEMQTQTHRYLPIAYFHLGLLLEYLLRSLSLPSKTKERPENILVPALPFPFPHESTDERMRKMVAYIDENLASSLLSAEKIAAQFHLSPVHLRRLFQQELGISTMKFVAGRRLEFARQLLRESSFNIEQIALYCGYKYPANFTNAFLHHFGVSPSAFRQGARPDGRKS